VTDDGIRITNREMWTLMQGMSATLAEVKHTGDETARRLTELTASLRSTADDHESRLREVEKFTAENDTVRADVEDLKRKVWRAAGAATALASVVGIVAGLAGHML